MAEGFKRVLPKLAGLVLAASAAMAAGSAQAQPFFGYFGYRTYEVPSTLPPEAVYRQLVRVGYQPLGRIQRNGRVFIADVIDPRRRQLRLVIDSSDGTILERYMIAARAATSDEFGVSAPLRQPDVRPPARRKPEPRTASRIAPPDNGADRNRAVPPVTGPEVIPAPIPQAAPVRPDRATRSEPSVAEVPATPAPRREQAPAAAPRGEGPGYANGVPINPLE
jgi:hypothetical protein